jgi:hypothetical protein
MKKRYIVHTYSVFIVSGCSGFLDETAYSKFDKSEAFKNRFWFISTRLLQFIPTSKSRVWH